MYIEQLSIYPGHWIASRSRWRQNNVDLGKQIFEIALKLDVSTDVSSVGVVSN